MTKTASNAKRFFDLSRKIRGRIYSSYLELLHPGGKITSAQALLELRSLLNTNQYVCREVIDELKRTHRIHALNDITYRKIMSTSLGGVQVRDIGLKATRVYYEKGEKPVMLGEFLLSSGWEDIDDEGKQEVVEYFGVRDPGPIAQVEMSMEEMPYNQYRFYFKGSDWEFEITTGHFHKASEVWMAFQGDLGRLGFLDEVQEYDWMKKLDEEK